ncbi:Sec-independent protein translocase subunit TatA [Nocardioides panacisoli]|uniref:Sec-independent protein translocase protein TatA n=1 Tax=Nocardioides panacisoli TaxID=627624 RepID=A0ABP7IPY6_9ACTN
MTTALVAMPGGWELVLIVLVILVLFGAKKLPEFARGSGQALRIFKAETKGLRDDDDEEQPAQPATPVTPTTAELPSGDEVAEGEIVEPRRDTTSG